MNPTTVIAVTFIGALIGLICGVFAGMQGAKTDKYLRPFLVAALTTAGFSALAAMFLVAFLK